MADVFEVLRLDHDELRRLLAQLHIGPTGLTGATANQLAAREKLTGQLIIAESRHESVEARYFWPAVRRHGPEATALADLAAAQEDEAARALAALAALNVQATEFEPLLTEVISAGLEHIDFEELEVWPQLRQSISPGCARQLGSEIALGLEAG